MDKFNPVPRSVSREAEKRRDHLDIFREFLDHVGRGSYRRPDETSPGDRRIAK